MWSCQQELSFNHILHAYVLSKQQSIHNIIRLHNVFNPFYTIRGWANCGIPKHHGSLVTEQNFAKHGDRIFSSTGSFINSNLWNIQIIVQLNLNFQKICTSCSIFVRSFWFIQATDSEIFNMPYGILEMRNDQFSKESGTNFAVFHSIEVSTWLNYF